MRTISGEKTKTMELTMAALFAALVAVSTMVIKLPIPITGGYIHPGDGLVILSGICLGPAAGAAAAGFGSALADLLSGYVVYAPATLIIKGACAWIAGMVFVRIKSRMRVAVSGALAELWMIAGYFLFESVMYNPQTAGAAAPFNGLQGLFGVLIACGLSPFVLRLRRG